jgi:hypothetical protein
LDAVTVPLDVLVGIFTDALTVFVPSELCATVKVLLNKVILPDVVTEELIFVVVVNFEPLKVNVLVVPFLSFEEYVQWTVTLQVTDDELFATLYEFSLRLIEAVIAILTSY